ncbi:MAG: hypothetical protein FWC20_09605 [Oscillospiraceae bacterium]|nr:hypothetical protein [Oscillospiraceae bacterium]MCL2279645.1 hypothetical protein [Oscillospiraceae bacterium]
MDDKYNIDEILSNLRILPDAEAKRHAYERMMAQCVKAPVTDSETKLKPIISLPEVISESRNMVNGKSQKHVHFGEHSQTFKKNYQVITMGDELNMDDLENVAGGTGNTNTTNNSVGCDELQLVIAGGLDNLERDEINNYYDPLICTKSAATSRCRVGDGEARCVYLTINPIEDVDSPGAYRYTCAKSCFNYISYVRLH